MQKFTIFFIFIYCVQQSYIIKRFIGFGDNYPEDDNSYIKTIPENDPYIGINEQALIACQCLIEIKKNLEQEGNYLVLIGYSQGGLVVRHMFNICDQIRPVIKRIITIGTPNLGLDQISVFYENQQQETELNDIQKQQLIDKYGKVPEVVQNKKQQYFKGFLTSISNIVSNYSFMENQCPKVYLNKQGQVTELIQELNLNKLTNDQFEILKNDYEKLEYFLSLGFSKDNVISPIDSSLFGSNIRIIDNFNQNEFDIKKSTFEQVKQLKFQLEKNEIENEIQQEDNEEYINDLKKYIQKKEFNLQKDIQNFKANQKLHVDRFNIQDNTQKFIRKYITYKVPKPKKQEDIVQWEENKNQFYNNQEVPLFYILSNLFSNKKLLLCAVEGQHLKFPDELYFVGDVFINMKQLLDLIATSEQLDETFEQQLDIFNCQRERYQFIQLTKKVIILKNKKNQHYLQILVHI